MVDMEEKSATSYSKRTIWTLDDSLKAIGASNLLSTNWNHATINFPPTEYETLVRSGQILNEVVVIISKSYFVSGIYSCRT